MMVKDKLIKGTSTMTYDLDLTPTQMAAFLTIAKKQRERAATKFIQDYGPSSASVAEINRDIGQLNKAIADLSNLPTPIERVIRDKK